MRKPQVLSRPYARSRERPTHQYDRQWKRFREAMLRRRRVYCAEHDLHLCVDCAAMGRHYHAMSTPVELDHVAPLSLAPHLKYAHYNVEFRCKQHHAARTKLGEYLPRPGRHVICGLPAAGKSTYVMENALHGDLVWDADRVADQLGFGPPPWTDDQRRLIVWRRKIWIRSAMAADRFFLIVTRVKVAHRIAARLHARVIPLAVNEDTRQQRLRQRKLR